jgi:hypothetical protein
LLRRHLPHGEDREAYRADAATIVVARRIELFDKLGWWKEIVEDLE